MGDDREGATYRALAGGSFRQHTEPRMADTLTGWLATLVQAAGGNVTAMARTLDVPRRTVRDWLTGTTAPGPARRELVRDRAAALARDQLRAERRRRLRPSREARLRAAVNVQIIGTDRYVEKGGRRSRRDTTFHIGRTGTDGMRSDTIDKLIDRFLGGEGRDQGGLFKTLVEGMTDPNDWYQSFFGGFSGPLGGCDIKRVNIT